MLTAEQAIGVGLLLFGSFLFGYMRGREAERRSFREFVLTNILKELKDIPDVYNAKKNSSELDETE